MPLCEHRGHVSHRTAECLAQAAAAGAVAQHSRAAGQLVVGAAGQLGLDATAAGPGPAAVALKLAGLADATTGQPDILAARGAARKIAATALGAAGQLGQKAAVAAMAAGAANQLGLKAGQPDLLAATAGQPGLAAAAVGAAERGLKAGQPDLPLQAVWGAGQLEQPDLKAAQPLLAARAVPACCNACRGCCATWKDCWATCPACCKGSPARPESCCATGPACTLEGCCCNGSMVAT